MLWARGIIRSHLKAFQQLFYSIAKRKPEPPACPVSKMSSKAPQISLVQVTLPLRRSGATDRRKPEAGLAELCAKEDLSVLSTDELERAERFRSLSALVTFVTVRSRLRRFLGRLLNADPNQLHFSYGDEGKPSLAPPFDQLHFNVSHTDGAAVMVASRETVLGVDIENTTRHVDLLALAKRYFSPSEYRQLLEGDEAGRVHNFFRIWTAKEAYIKARARGLKIPLDQFSIALDTQDDCRLGSTEHDPGAFNQWSLMRLKMPDPFVATLCHQMGLHGTIDIHELNV